MNDAAAICAAKITRMMLQSEFQASESSEQSEIVREGHIVILKSRTVEDLTKDIILIIINPSQIPENEMISTASFVSVVLRKVNGHIQRFSVHVVSDNIDNLRMFNEHFIA